MEMEHQLRGMRPCAHDNQEEKLCVQARHGELDPADQKSGDPSQNLVIRLLLHLADRQTDRGLVDREERGVGERQKQSRQTIIKVDRDIDK